MIQIFMKLKQVIIMALNFKFGFCLTAYQPLWVI